LIKDDPVFLSNSQTSPQADPSVQLATALYQLGLLENSTVRSAEQLGLGEGTLRLYLWPVVHAILGLQAQFLQWPRDHEYRRMRSEVEEWSDFPGCVGFLDGSDIGLRFSSEWQAETYFN